MHHYHTEFADTVAVQIYMLVTHHVFGLTKNIPFVVPCAALAKRRMIMAKYPRTAEGVTVFEDKILSILKQYPDGLDKLELTKIVWGSTANNHAIAASVGRLREAGHVRVDYHQKIPKYYMKEKVKI